MIVTNAKKRRLLLLGGGLLSGGLLGRLLGGRLLGGRLLGGGLLGGRLCFFLEDGEEERRGEKVEKEKEKEKEKEDRGGERARNERKRGGGCDGARGGQAREAGSRPVAGNNSERERERERAEGERREKKENEERERERTSSAHPLPLALFSLAARSCHRGRAQTRCFRSEGDRKEWKGEAASERDRQAERRGRGLAERDEQSEGAFEGGTKKITTKSPRPELTLRGRLLRRRLLRGGGLLHGGLLDGGLLGLGTGEGGRKRKRKDGQHLILLERKKEKTASTMDFVRKRRARSESLPPIYFNAAPRGL